jgi:long-chain acyl-CoA synthetase
VATGMTTKPTGASLQRLAEQAWDRLGAGPVLHFEDSQWTGDQLADRVRRVAAGLVEAGVRPGERVVVCMANCPEVTISYAAVWRAGAVTTPVLFLVSEDELRHILTDSGAVLAITTPEFLAKVTAAAAGAQALRAVVVVGELPADTGTQPATPLLPFAELETVAPGAMVDTDPSALAALLYTGGTTGRAKGVMISHDALSAAAWAATAATHQDAPGTALLPLPLSHSYGLMVSVMSLHAPEPGVSVLMRWFDPAGWLQLAERYRVSVSPLVPSMLTMLLGQPLEDYDLSALTRLTSGSAPLPRRVIEEFGKRLPGVAIVEGYGCTETAALISATPAAEARAGSVGKPVSGVEIRIELPDGAAAGPGEDGEICVRGPVLMSGYWHAEDETAATLRGGWLHTGDVGRLDEDGYLYIVDRIKDVIIRGGYNVYPRDIEDVLQQHPAVAAAAVVGRPDQVYGEEVVAFVQLRDGATTSPEELAEFTRGHVSAVKYPREVRIVDAIPLTSMLKTDRKKLRGLLADG